MHTIWVRLNAVVFFGLTVLLCLSLLAALSKIGHTKWYQPKIYKLELNKLRSLKNHGGVDRALLSFDLHVSLEFFSVGDFCDAGIGDIIRYASVARMHSMLTD